MHRIMAILYRENSDTNPQIIVKRFDRMSLLGLKERTELLIEQNHRIIEMLSVKCNWGSFYLSYFYFYWVKVVIFTANKHIDTCYHFVLGTKFNYEGFYFRKANKKMSTVCSLDIPLLFLNRSTVLRCSWTHKINLQIISVTFVFPALANDLPKISGKYQCRWYDNIRMHLKKI